MIFLNTFFTMGKRMNRRLVLFTTSLGAFLTPFTSTVITFAVPGIGAEFRASFYQVIWVPLSFLIALPSFMMVLGKLSDIFGRVFFFKMGFLIFIISSFFIYLSGNIYELAIFAFLTGVGGAFIGTNSTAIVSYVYPKKKRGGALGINAMSVYLGLTLAPFLGGILIQLYGWRSIFLLNIPIAAAALIISFFTLRGIDIKKKEKLDWKGAFLFSSSLLLIVIYLTTMDVYGANVTIPLLIGGIILFSLFILNEFINPSPIIDTGIFKRSRTFTFSNISAFLNYVSTFSIVFIFSIYLEVIKGVDPFHTGLILSIEPVLMVSMSPVSGKLSDIYGSREIAALGTGIIGLGFLMLYFLNLSIENIILSLAVIGIGFGLFAAPNTNSVMGSVDKRSLSLASGILGTMRFTGQIFSLTISGLIISGALPRKVLIMMFTGYLSSYNITNAFLYMDAMKNVMLVSALLSFAASFTSLMKNRGE